MSRLVPTFLALLVAGSGCGYSLVRYGGALVDVRSVAVSTPSNESYEPGIEFVVADALRREFLRRGAVRLTRDSSSADLVIDGAVEEVRTISRSFSTIVLVLEYEVTMRLDVRATLNDGSKIPLEARALRETERYLTSADVEVTRKNRDEALRRIADVLAGRIYDGLSEGLTP